VAKFKLTFLFCVLTAALGLLSAIKAQAQEKTYEFLTVERPPFAMIEDEQATGFSIELMQAIGRELDHEISFRFEENFTNMLGQVEAGLVDGAIANISITRAREAAMDFSLPIYRGGLQIMVQREQGMPGLWTSVFSAELAFAVVAAFALLFGGGMLMWVFERGKQPYFDRPASEALFPSFWWALNLVVNGGFEERMPRSILGRVFGTFLVVASLFVVSVFVAHITASVTVQTLSGSINSISDLDGKRVGTTRGSTASLYLEGREIAFTPFESLDLMLRSFEAGLMDAVVFDGPILAHYVRESDGQFGQLLPVVFWPEDYGIAFPAGSFAREGVNVALLQLYESGEYEQIAKRWFGVGNR
jgi:polar amino acid transport system substrate-binding protein